MSKGINRVFLIGNATKDAETRYLPSGGAVSNFTIATSEYWKDRDSGERKEKTEFHRCVAFNKLAEIVGQFLKKGGKVYVEGKLVTRQWEKDGQKHYTTEIHVSEFQMLDGRRDTGADDDRGFDEHPETGHERQQRKAGTAPAPAAGGGGGGFDDDIPFAPYPSNYAF